MIISGCIGAHPKMLSQVVSPGDPAGRPYEPVFELPLDSMDRVGFETFQNDETLLTIVRRIRGLYWDEV
jgi:hypothetical protein